MHPLHGWLASLQICPRGRGQGRRAGAAPLRFSWRDACSWAAAAAAVHLSNPLQQKALPLIACGGLWPAATARGTRCIDLAAPVFQYFSQRSSNPSLCATLAWAPARPNPPPAGAVRPKTLTRCSDVGAAEGRCCILAPNLISAPKDVTRQYMKAYALPARSLWRAGAAMGAWPDGCWRGQRQGARRESTAVPNKCNVATMLVADLGAVRISRTSTGCCS
jgi:hypothetical protein